MSEHVRIRTTPNKNVVLLMRKLSNFVQKLAPMIDTNIAKQQIINILRLLFCVEAIASANDSFCDCRGVVVHWLCAGDGLQ